MQNPPNSTPPKSKPPQKIKNKTPNFPTIFSFDLTGIEEFRAESNPGAPKF
jgi:hypothetical protein